VFLPRRELKIAGVVSAEILAAALLSGDLVKDDPEFARNSRSSS
jgi:hypothetical protein